MEGLLHLSFNRPFPEEEARLKNLWGKIRYKSYIIINQSQKSKSKFFTFSWPLRGRGGGQPKRSAWPKLFVKMLGLFSHWIWFLDTQNRFYFIVKRLKNGFSMYLYCLFNYHKTAKPRDIMECLKMAFGWPPLSVSLSKRKAFYHRQVI